MVGDVPTGGTAIAPTMRETFAADAGEMCSRVGCDRAATLFWYEKCTGERLAYCPEDGVEAFGIIKRWMREPEARMSIERHAIAVEKAANRGLYDQPMRWRGSYDGDDRKMKP